MGVDTSIYGNQQRFEAPSLLDSQTRAATLSGIALKNQATQQSMGNEQRSSDMANHLQKASAFGNALEGISGLPPEQRAQAYGQVRNQLVQGGVLKPEDAPEQYDDGFYKSSLMRYRSSKDAIENQLGQAHAANFKAEANKNNAEAGKLNAEAAKRNPGAADYGDPAKMVANFVPKEHQAQAFKEIDAAENTKNMSKSIMQAFDDATKDTSGVGALTSMVKTPRSQLALHQAMQPTFKDLEGTVRQAAMDNTFKNITPNGSDSAQDIATKRAALQDYLQSKSSSPIARAYGIDLAKFPSTAKYESAAPDAGGRAADLLKGGSGGGMIASAQAAPPPIKPGTEEGGHIFMGGDPADPKSWKKAR